MWVSDGTVDGTHILKDIRPGVSSSNLTELTNIGGTLYFSANDGSAGYELWKSDGTWSGTTLVADISPGQQGSGPSRITEFKGELYFRANDGSRGEELWKSNGTPAGTVLMKDIGSGITSGQPDSLTNVAGTLYFSAFSTTTGRELWKTSGTPESTILVADIRPGVQGSEVSAIHPVEGMAYFSATDGVTGREVWRSDGTITGTQLVGDAEPGFFGVNPTQIVNTGKAVFMIGTTLGEGEELFLVSTPPSAPSGIQLVPNPGQEQLPTLVWQSMSAATSYEIIVNTAAGVRVDTGTSETAAYTVSSRLPIGRYSVWVRAVNEVGKSQWSSAYSLSINVAVTLLPPQVGGEIGTPLVRWNPVDGATSYEVLVETSPVDASLSKRFTVTNATSWSPETPLTLGAWKIWVRAVMPDGYRSQWSLPTETTNNAAPRIISGNQPTFDQTPDLSWEPVAGATSYEVYIRNLGNGQISQLSNLSDTVYVPTSDMAVGRYQWWVRGANSLGFVGKWSAGSVLEIGGRPTIVSPKNSVTGEVLFSWTKVLGAQRYELWVNQLNVSEGVIKETALTSNEFRTTSLAAGSYRVWVRAVSTTGQTSLWSWGADFVVT